MRNIIIVPVKNTSKRFPRKNWMKIGGKTLFELALERAIKSKLGKVVLATDNLKVVVRAGCDIDDFDDVEVEMISKELSEKRALDVCLWVIEAYQERGKKFDNIIVILPTSPLATEKHIREAYQAFLDNDRQTLACFSPISGRPLLYREGVGGLSVYPCYDRIIYRDTGIVYIDRVDEFLKRKEWFDYRIIPYFVDEVLGIDIDTKWDYLTAKAFYKEL